MSALSWSWMFTCVLISIKTKKKYWISNTKLYSATGLQVVCLKRACAHIYIPDFYQFSDNKIEKLIKAKQQQQYRQAKSNFLFSL